MKKIDKIIISLLYIAALVFVLSLNFGISVVDGDSMYPTLKSGDILIVDKKAVPESGDIITLNYKPDGGKHDYIVKRLDHYENNQFYVLGDNAEISYDSRYFGTVSGDTFVGKVIYHVSDIFGFFNFS